MCCGCIDGSYSEPEGVSYNEEPTYDHECVNSANGVTDSFGDGCQWYDLYSHECGNYDSP
jgi:hypothetical protein